MSSIDSAIIKALVDHIGMDPSIVPDADGGGDLTSYADIVPGSPYLDRSRNQFVAAVGSNPTYYGFSSEYLSVGDILLLETFDGKYQAGVVSDITYAEEDKTKKKFRIQTIRNGVYNAFIFSWSSEYNLFISVDVNSNGFKEPDNVTTGFFYPSTKFYSTSLFLKDVLFWHTNQHLKTIHEKLAGLQDYVLSQHS